MMEELSLRLKEECGVDVDGGEADWAEEASEDADEEEVRAAAPEPMGLIPLLPSVERMKLDAN